MLNFVKRYRIYLFIALGSTLAVVLSALPSNAQTTDIVQSALDSMKETEAWWDKLWVTTFSNSANGIDGTTSLSDFMFTNVVRWFLALSLLFWVVRFLLNTGQLLTLSLPGMLQSVTPFMLSFLLVNVMLANNAAIAKSIPWGMRDNINAWRNGIMDARVVDLTVRGALNDVFSTKQSSAVITAQAQRCSQMPQPATVLPSPTRPTDAANLTMAQKQAYDFIECMEKLKEVAVEEQQKAQNATCSSIPGVTQACALTLRFLSRTVDSLTSMTKTEVERVQKGDVAGANLWKYNPVGAQMVLGDYLGGVMASMGFKLFLNAVQWVFISMMELGLWVDGLVAPIAVSLSLVPGQLNLTISWAISFLTIGLSQITYTAVIGAMALALAQNKTYFASDIRFELALGLFAPLVCTAVLTGGGLAASRAFTGQATGLAMAAVSITTGVSSSIMGAMSRFADAKR